MASKSTLNAKNLETLGAAHLAELLMDISEGNANAKRRLRMELAGSESPSKLANEIRKRLAMIAASTANVGWRTLKGFRGDLNTQRRLIVEQVLTSAPNDAADLMWQFIGLGDGVIERTSDASGGVIDVFREASQDIATILAAAKLAPDTWMRQVVTLQLANAYGQNDGLIPHIANLLDKSRIEDLRAMLVTAAKDPITLIASKPRAAKRWRKRILAAADNLRKRSRADSVKVALIALADALGDVDAYMALMADAYMPATAAQIAERLLKAGRPAEALKALDVVRVNRGISMPSEWVDTRLATLEALGRKDDAQTFRLAKFREILNPDYLRAYLKRLPDFDDVEAEDEALDRAKDFPNADAALGLLVSWPSLDRAANLVTKRVVELDGNKSDALTYAADRLVSRYPFAAMLLHRHIVEASLMSGQEQRHKGAALHYLEAESLAKLIDTFAQFGDHADWLNRLGKAYARRSAFWRALP